MVAPVYEHERPSRRGEMTITSDFLSGIACAVSVLAFIRTLNQPPKYSVIEQLEYDNLKELQRRGLITPTGLDVLKALEKRGVKQ